MSKRTYSVQIISIAAMDEGRVIGADGGLPWRIPEDMKRFSALTTGHTVLMGRKTYESLPDKYRPLPNRNNIVASRKDCSQIEREGAKVISNPIKFLEKIKKGATSLATEKLWIVGGEQIYRATLPLWEAIYLTRVAGEHSGDAFFPEFEDDFELAEREDKGGFAYEVFFRK